MFKNNGNTNYYNNTTLPSRSPYKNTLRESSRPFTIPTNLNKKDKNWVNKKKSGKRTENTFEGFFFQKTVVPLRTDHSLNLDAVGIKFPAYVDKDKAAQT